MNKAAVHDDTVAMQNDNLRVAVEETDFCHPTARRRGHVGKFRIWPIDLSRFFREVLASVKLMVQS